MYSYDLNTGQLSQDSCPRVHESELSPVEIVNNANLMGCGYGQMGVPPYNQSGGCNPQMNNPYQPQYGYNGYGIYFNTPQQNYNPYNQGMYMNPPTSGFGAYQGNPAFQYMQNNNMYQQNQYQQRPMAQDYTYWQPGHNTGSTMLFQGDIKAECDRLQAQMMDELEESYIKRTQNYNQYCRDMGYTNGTNYYGMPYIQQQNYYDPAIINKYRSKIEDMKQEAVQRRTDLNKQLSRLCHNYLDDGVTDEMIDEMYDGHMVTIPGSDIDCYYDQAKYSRMVEIDTSIIYKEHNRQVSEKMMSYFPKGHDTNMYEFFENAGKILMDEALEEEAHRRKDLSGATIPNTTYRTILRARKAKEDIENNITEKTGMSFNNYGGGNYDSFQVSKQKLINNLEYMSDQSIPIEERVKNGMENAQQILEEYKQEMVKSGYYKLNEDGELEIVIPDWVNSGSKKQRDEELYNQQQEVINNKKEQEYQEGLQRFRDAIYKRNTDMWSQVHGTYTGPRDDSSSTLKAVDNSSEFKACTNNSLPSSGGGGNDIRSVTDDSGGQTSSLYGGVDEDGEYWVL